jgi:hypothetical protein
MRISLTTQEQIRAAEVALHRIKEIAGRPDHVSRYDTKLTMVEYIAQITESVGAEIAVAKALRIEGFDPANSRFKSTADVAAGIEVKWTKYDEGSLIIYPSDRATDVAVLVVGKSPRYRIAGWMPVAVAKRDRYRHHSQPTWWVSQQNLQPIENLYRSQYANAAQV